MIINYDVITIKQKHPFDEMKVFCICVCVCTNLNIVSSSLNIKSKVKQA